MNKVRWHIAPDPGPEEASRALAALRAAMTVPGALEAFQQLAASATSAGIPQTTLYLVQLRASQINGCSGCVDIHSRSSSTCARRPSASTWSRRGGTLRISLTPSEPRWRSPRPRLVSPTVPTLYRTMSGMSAARHYSEPQLAALVVAIAAINAFNRLNVTTGQITGNWVAQIVKKSAQSA
jgi:alkylhydroperoxidase family enzyme